MVDKTDYEAFKQVCKFREECTDVKRPGHFACCPACEFKYGKKKQTEEQESE